MKPPVPTVSLVVVVDPAGTQTISVPGEPPPLAAETTWQHEVLVVQTLVPEVAQPFTLSAIDMVKEDFIY